jgi:hypothetical protein
MKTRRSQPEIRSTDGPSVINRLGTLGRSLAARHVPTSCSWWSLAFPTRGGFRCKTCSKSSKHPIGLAALFF